MSVRDVWTRLVGWDDRPLKGLLGDDRRPEYPPDDDEWLSDRCEQNPAYYRGFHDGYRAAGQSDRQQQPLPAANPRTKQP